MPHDKLDPSPRSAIRMERTVEQIRQIKELTSTSRQMISESLSLLSLTQPHRAFELPGWRRHRK